MADLYFILFILFLFGVFARIGVREKKRAWLLTLLCCLFLVGLAILAPYIPARTNGELYVRLLCWFAFTLGTVFSEIVCRIHYSGIE